MEKLVDPFAGLAVARELACEFFAVFSRFEYALKECGFLRNSRGRVEPDWDSYRSSIEHQLALEPDSAISKAIKYLTDMPPNVQIGRREWSDEPVLKGNTAFGQAISATQRVRNNLFHGGKHTPQEIAGRDELLVCSALEVLKGCLEIDENVRSAYNEPSTC